MIIKTLGILDILAGILFWFFVFFNFIPTTIILFFGLYLIVKGIAFVMSDHFASVLDIIVGIVFITALTLTIPKIITIIISLYLIQKGIFSLL